MLFVYKNKKQKTKTKTNKQTNKQKLTTHDIKQPIGETLPMQFNMSARPRAANYNAFTTATKQHGGHMKAL